MRDFILLMHRDATREPTPAMWVRYFAVLRERGAFTGGSTIGSGEVLRKEGTPGRASDQLGGYLCLRAEDLEAAKALLAGNPVYECGGTVEVRELPQD